MTKKDQSSIDMKIENLISNSDNVLETKTFRDSTGSMKTTGYTNVSLIGQSDKKFKGFEIDAIFLGIKP